ncbi:hypothetical protein BDR07DRAFT_1493811 [Suillus spraguei]|nr:hypothetical protein BDR07DRAFT_1493811 [Suillus spraguei]
MASDASKTTLIDTSFKRVHGWQEFEFESWDTTHTKFKFNSTRLLFANDCDHLLQLLSVLEHSRHLNQHKHTLSSSNEYLRLPVQTQVVLFSFNTYVEKGFKRSLLTDIKVKVSACRYDATALLRDLDPYEHLRRFYRLCLAHSKRNIRGLRGQIPKDGTSKIKKGGKKAAGKITGGRLKDKIEGTKFALPAPYQPNSLIPLEIWKASPTTTNGNEQAHRNINRDGVGLVLLGEIMRGFHYDTNICASLDLFDPFGINSTDHLSTHAYRAKQQAVADKIRKVFALGRQHKLRMCQSHPLTLPSVEVQPPNSLLISSSTVIPIIELVPHLLVLHFLPRPQYISIFLPLETN